MCIFFFNDTATTEIYTLSLHDALPISVPGTPGQDIVAVGPEHDVIPPTRADRIVAVAADDRVIERSPDQHVVARAAVDHLGRSEEHTSELQSQSNLVCRLLLEKKKKPL